MRRLICLTLVAGLSMAVCLPALSQDLPTLPFHELGDIAVSTHIPWASPLAGGPIEILAIAPYHTMADVARLASHLEVKISTVATWDRDHLGYDPLFPEAIYPDASYEQVEKRLSKALENKKLDVIIIGSVATSTFPEAIQQRIIERVEAGAGLLLTGPEETSPSALTQWLNASSAFADPPQDLAAAGPLGLLQADEQNILDYRQAGEGRIARLTFRGFNPPSHSLIPVPINPYVLNPEHEANAYSLVCKTILWSCGREAENKVARIVDVTPKGPDDEEIPPGYPREFIEAVRRNAFNQPLRPYVLELDSPATTSYDVVYQLRVPGAGLPAWRVPSGTVIPKGELRCALDVIASPGEYFLDVWLTTRKGIVAWHTAAIGVTGWPQISNVSITHDGEEAVWLHPNDHLDLRVDIETGAFLTSGEPATVLARAVDSFDRQVSSATATIGPEGGTVSLRLELADLLAPLIRVEVFAVQSTVIADAGLSGQAARLTYFFPVRLPEPPLEPTVVLSSSAPFDYDTIRQLSTLRALTGSRTLHTKAGVEGLLAADSAGLERLAQVGSLDSGHVGDNETRIPCLSSEAHWSRETERIHAGVLESWAGGPAWYTLGADCALTTTEANVCQSPDCLARFQDYLRSSYANLDGLNQAWGSRFTSWESVRPMALDQCQQDQRWSPWLDFRHAMDSVFAGAMGRGREAVYALPGAGRVGFQAPTAPGTPLMGYDWRQITAATDFATAPATPYAMRRLQSYHSSSVYNGIVLGNQQLRGQPEENARVPWQALFRQLPAIWLDRPVGLGPKNVLTPAAAPEPAFAALVETLNTIHGGAGGLILNATPQQAGIAFVDSPASRMLDYADPDPLRTADDAEAWLERALNQAGFATTVQHLNDPLEGLNTLILSRCRVLSNREVEALQAFHDAGGLILADGPAGAFDEHGRARPRAPLPFLHPLENKDPGETVALSSNRPVWLKSASDSGGIIDVLAQLLTRAGNVPGHPIRLPDKQAGQVDRYQYQYGAATIIACLPQIDIKTTLKRASLDVPEDHYGYDLLSPEASPTGRRLQWTMLPNQPSIFTLLPYRVEEIEVLAPESVFAGQRLALAVHLDTGDTPPGDHYILVRLHAPDASEVRHYRQAIRMAGGNLETYIPLAENEVPGFYTVAITDVLTRQTREHVIEIQ